MAYLNNFISGIKNLTGVFRTKKIPATRPKTSLILLLAGIVNTVAISSVPAAVSGNPNPIMGGDSDSATGHPDTDAQISRLDSENVWHWLAEHSTLDHPSHPAIDRELELYSRDIYWTGRKLQDAQPYLYHVISQLRARKLPTELALIPVIESSYNPRAQSKNNAAGLWQFVPVTARGVGLKVGTWIDERRSIERSTAAALDYLHQMHSEFNDWSLAVAAYNAGPSRLRARIRKHGKEDFTVWDLSLPEETRRYVAKFFALNQLVVDADTNELDLPDIKPQQQFQRVDAGQQISLSVAADLAGLEHSTLDALNHELITGGTPPNGPHSLLIPVEAVDAFTSGLASAIAESRSLYQPTVHHKVNYGETLSQIAVDYRTTVRRLKELNSLKNGNIRSGQTLLVAHYGPAVEAARRSSAKIPPEYRVRKGDTLSEIAHRYGLTRSLIAKTNNIDNDNFLREGKILIMPAKYQPEDDAFSSYTVKAGDTLSHIAHRFKITLNKLRELNPPLAEAHNILPGQRVVVPAIGL